MSDNVSEIKNKKFVAPLALKSKKSLGLLPFKSQKRVILGVSPGVNQQSTFSP